MVHYILNIFACVVTSFTFQNSVTTCIYNGDDDNKNFINLFNYFIEYGTSISLEVLMYSLFAFFTLYFLFLISSTTATNFYYHCKPFHYHDSPFLLPLQAISTTTASHFTTMTAHFYYHCKPFLLPLQAISTTTASHFTTMTAHFYYHCKPFLLPLQAILLP